MFVYLYIIAYAKLGNACEKGGQKKPKVLF